MKIADMIRQALDEKGIQGLKDASNVLGVSYELLRVMLHEGHVPKDKTLGRIADKLGMDKPVLVMAAHQERVPVELKGFFLSPAPQQSWRQRRVYPLSEEQCNHLGAIMTPGEIQMIRKFRQVTSEAQIQIGGYIDYIFAEKRTPREARMPEAAVQDHRELFGKRGQGARGKESPSRRLVHAEDEKEIRLTAKAKEHS
jgi:hypothetical protein